MFPFVMLKYGIRTIRIFGLSVNTLFGLPIDEKVLAEPFIEHNHRISSGAGLA